MSPNVSIRLLAVQPDGRLVDLVGRGNERAFEALVGRYRGPLLRYCSRLGLSEPVAEDVVQHSLLKAWLALVDGTPVRELRPWLYRIVHNMAISSIRVTREQPGGLPETIEPALLGSTPAGAEDRLALREALGQVAALPKMQRHAIVLTAIEGRSHGEAASVMGISDGAVRGLIHRARTSMRSAAAAFMPPGLQAWLSRGSEAVPLAERSGEISAGAGVLGLGALAKAALLAATAAVLVAGGSVVRGGRHSGARAKSHSATSAAAGARTSTLPGGFRAVTISSQAAGSQPLRGVSTGQGSEGAAPHRRSTPARPGVSQPNRRTALQLAPVAGGQPSRAREIVGGRSESLISLHREGPREAGSDRGSGNAGSGQDRGGEAAGSTAGGERAGSGDSEAPEGHEGGGAYGSGTGGWGGDSPEESAQLPAGAGGAGEAAPTQAEQSPGSGRTSSGEGH